MITCSTLRSRTAIVAGVALISAIAISPVPAYASGGDNRNEYARALDPAPDSADWGTVAPNAGCAQADAWIASIRGVAGLVDTKLFEAHSPPTPNAPESRGGGKDMVNLTVPNPLGAHTGLGAASALYTRALANKLPGNPGGDDLIPVPCVSYAEAGGATVDAGFPYASSPIPHGTQLSPVGVHIEGVSVEATGIPGRPVAFGGGLTRGYFSMLGNKIITIPPVWPVNLGVRVPADRSQPVLALAVTNEQVTTTRDGRPTLDSTGQYVFDPTASSGYINAVHASLLGTNGADVVIGHAAVLTNGAS